MQFFGNQYTRMTDIMAENYFFRLQNKVAAEMYATPKINPQAIISITIASR